MDAGPFVALAALTLLTMVGNRFWPSRTRRINRALAARPRALLQAAHGLVRVTGRVVRIGELLQGPLSGRACVAYELLVDERVRADRGMSGWRRLVEERQACSFAVADESGVAHVDTSGPFLLALRSDRSGATSWFRRYPGEHAALAQLLEATNVIATSTFGTWRGFRYSEAVLEEGAVVSVGGDSAREVDPAGDRPDLRSPPERVILRGSETQPLLISDGRQARS